MSAPLRWLVVGAGRAGRIRARDIAAEPGHTLHLHLPGRTPAAALHAAITAAPVDAVAICVENARHGDLAAAALKAGRHVLVEFPLCHTAAGAAALIGAAQTSGLVLHVELIGLLTERHIALRRRAEQIGIKALRVEFCGGLYGWVAAEVAASRWGQLAVGRLHALWELAGPLHLDTVQLDEPIAGGYRLEVQLTGRHGEQIELVERRSAALARGIQWVGLDRRGAPIERLRAGAGSVPLFLQDLRRCAARIRGDKAAAYVTQAVILEVVGLAERISKLAQHRQGLAAARDPNADKMA